MNGVLHRKSHETTPTLSAPTPSTFPLDFAQLLQATTANPSRRSKVGRMPAVKEGIGEQGKDRETRKGEEIVDVDSEEGWNWVETQL